jgi:phosphoribosylamine--glycine ligase
LNILVIGGGGREHALVRAIRRNPDAERVFCAPGNAGIAREADCPNLQVEDISAVVTWIRRNHIDLTVIGPEKPLTTGLSDRLEQDGYRVFGPSRSAAEIESSKVFAKEFMARHEIPTASFDVFSSARAAKDHLRHQQERPLVVKADGLAAGKGVMVCDNLEEALDAVNIIMEKGTFGEAGRRVVIEERLSGPEVSVFALTDGYDIKILPTVRDYKRALDGDQGLNTGGMGAYAPLDDVDEDDIRDIEDRILLPTLRGLATEGRPYRGVLYAGLMMTADGPMVLEYNARFGDPEAQILVPLLRSDLLTEMASIAEGSLAHGELDWHDGSSVGVVACSEGYPDVPVLDRKIKGIDEADALDGVDVFHAGTRKAPRKTVLTGGGRVLAVVAQGRDRDAARTLAYEALAKIQFEGMHFRTDIAAVSHGAIDASQVPPGPSDAAETGLREEASTGENEARANGPAAGGDDPAAGGDDLEAGGGDSETGGGDPAAGGAESDAEKT